MLNETGIKKSAWWQMILLLMVEGEGFEPSKLAQQIYSLPPLTARESLHKRGCILMLHLQPVNINFQRFSVK